MRKSIRNGFLPYNPHPMEFQNSARNFRAAGNFRVPVGDPPKTQNATGNRSFLPNFHPCMRKPMQILSRWGAKTLRIREFPECPEPPAIFLIRAQIGALLYRGNTTWGLAISCAISIHL